MHIWRGGCCLRVVQKCGLLTGLTLAAAARLSGVLVDARLQHQPSDTRKLCTCDVWSGMRGLPSMTFQVFDSNAATLSASSVVPVASARYIPPTASKSPSLLQKLRSLTLLPCTASGPQGGIPEDPIPRNNLRNQVEEGGSHVNNRSRRRSRWSRSRRAAWLSWRAYGPRQWRCGTAWRPRGPRRSGMNSARLLCQGWLQSSQP